MGAFSRSPAPLPTQPRAVYPFKKRRPGRCPASFRREFMEMHVITFDQKMAPGRTGACVHEGADVRLMGGYGGRFRRK